jgi:glucose-6-phosphate 1-dehydrogenase
MKTDLNTIFRIKEPLIFTVYGASGDLAKLKIFPALFALAEQNRFPEKLAIVGYARSQSTQADFRNDFKNSVKDRYVGTWGEYQDSVLEKLLPKVHYFSGQYDRFDDFKNFKQFLAEKLACKTWPQHLMYFSVPPFVVKPILAQVAEVFKPRENDLRLILEKPFGSNEDSAQQMFHFLSQHYTESQLYFLDHYLGKKAVRSLIPLRHMNRILNSMLKGREIANIQISAIEPMGVGERIGYFDEVGTIKDVVQSHLLQVLAMLTMSIPIDDEAERVQEERTSILNALDFLPDKNHLCLGQYEGYKGEHEKVKNSDTETFAALRLSINRETWHDVPIFLRTGKKLDAKHTYLVVELKKFSFQDVAQEPNRVIIEFYPQECIQIRLLDEDGATLRHGEIAASESIACHGDYCLPEHGLLILDVVRGEKRFFLGMPEIVASWHIVDQVVNFITAKKLKPEIYKVGTKGPKGQHNLMKGTNFSWYQKK